MRMMTSCKLISFSPDAHEVGTDPVSVSRTVKCQELSLTQAEVYKGERALEYKDERWTVLRTDPYKDWNGVILLIRRVKGNSADAGSQVVPPAQSETQEVG